MRPTTALMLRAFVIVCEELCDVEKAIVWEAVALSLRVPRVPRLATGSGEHKQQIFYGKSSEYGMKHNPPLYAGRFMTFFRFSPDRIPDLVAALEIPAVFKTSGSECTCDGEEALLIFLHRMAYPSQMEQLCVFFGSCVGRLSEIVEAAVRQHLHVIADRLLSNFDVDRWRRAIPRSAMAIHDAGSPMQFCFGFIDGTFTRIARPSVDGYAGDAQRDMFSGHKHEHGERRLVVCNSTFRF